MNKENIEAVYKLSPMQEGILYHALLSPGTGSYVEQSYTGLEGELDLASFNRAWQLVIKRHDVLRTSFLWENLDQPVQIVHRQAALELEQLDWSHLSEQEQELEGRRFMKQDRLVGFDLTKLPLQRVRLIRLAPQRYRLLWTFHHILMDGWSSDLVSNEMRTFYGLFVQGKEVNPPKVVPYRTYIQWLARQDMAAAERYWRERLGSFHAPNGFGVSRPVRGEAREAYGQEKYLVPMGLVSALKKQARQHQLTLYTLVQAAWAVLLSRYSGDHNVVFGSTTAGRTVPIEGIEQMIGVFIHTLPVRVEVEPDRNLVTWLRGLQQEHLRAAAFEHAPLQKIHAWSGVPGSQQLFESILVYENYIGGVATSKRTETTKFSNDTTTNYPLTFIVYPGVDIYFRMIYDLRRFNDGLVRAMMAHMEELLRGMAEELERPVASLNLVTAEERRLLFQTWNDTAEPYPAGDDMGHLLDRAALRFADRPALTFIDEQRRERRLDYAALDRRVTLLAGQLRRLGVGPDQLVGVITERGTNMLTALLALLRLGAGYLPLDPSFPEARIAYIANDAGIGLLLTESHLAERLPACAARVIVLDSEGQIADLAPAPPLQPRPCAPDGVCYMIYTSGSTGKPKGVTITHRNLVNYMNTLCPIFGIGPQDTWFGLATFTFDISVMELFMPLVVGAQLIYTSKRLVVDDQALIALIEEKRTTWMQATPATWRMLVSGGFRGHDQLNIVSGGEALPYELSHQLQARCKTLWNNYGPTETTIYTNYRPIRERTPEKEIGAIEPIGPNLGNTEIYILDRQMNLLPLMVPGEIFLGGLLLARGYHGQPGMTAAKFVPDPYSGRPGARLYRSGDLGRFLPDHTIESFGRADHQVKLRGFRIELGEVDASLSLHPELEVAATAMRELRPGEQALVAYIVPRPGCAPEPERLRAFLAKSLPDYMIPSHFAVLEKMPMSARGKADRNALPAFGTGLLPAARGGERPGNEAERTLAAIWQALLGLDQVGVEDNFFDIGGHSLRLVQLRGKIQQAFQREISMMDLFEHTTIRAQARFLVPELEVVQPEIPADTATAPTPTAPAVADDAGTTSATPPPVAVAVIGMACRVPGADDVDRFWTNIREGQTSIRFFSDEEMLALGVAPVTLENPHFIRARGCLEDIELFDAAFFNINPREAELTDPQHRVFLEGAWQALEHAGVDPGAFPGRIAIFGGAGINTYVYENLLPNTDLMQGLSWHQLALGNDASFLTTRISYKLDLRGPSMLVQTACSTSLVAIIQAAEYLLAGRCDLALAGGVAVTASQKTGYTYTEGGILSSDGHCRPFDAAASGTVFGSGMGMVVLARLEDALAWGDPIHAVVRGFALNNDGAAKAGYTAPSIEGQTRVVREAQLMGGIDPGTIGYVEAHGTATPLGDPIEAAALTQAFRQVTAERGFCALGSVKANVGHLDTAAGVTGFIKAVCALSSGLLPPCPHFKAPNPAIDLADSPFYVVDRLRPWPNREGQPRRAAVSSFGIGGTNAHLILEQAPPLAPANPVPGPHLLPFSARNQAALAQRAADLAKALRERPELELDAVALTLQTGRKTFEHRGYLVCATVAEAVERLEQGRYASGLERAQDRPVTLMFTGQGSQHPGMAAELYQRLPEFRRVFDHCARLLAPRLGLDLAELLFGAERDEAEVARTLAHTAITQPALFAVEYALARLWLGWGLRIEAMIGHSVGEYVAACLAGVFTLEDALMVVAERGRLMQAQPEGAMLAVALEEAQLAGLLAADLELAAVNAPARCTVAGPLAAIEDLERRLVEAGHYATRLPTSHAYHCALMEGAVAPFEALLRGLVLRPPQLPFVSCLSGDWITPAQAVDPCYWSAHLRRTVRFADGAATLLREPRRLLLELGPGETLTGLVRRHPARGEGHLLVAALPKRREHDQLAFALESLGVLWLAGARLDWRALNSAPRPRRVALPSYPFQRERFWIDPPKSGRRRSGQRGTVDNWYYLPGWRAGLAPVPADLSKASAWLLFGGPGSFSQALRARLESAGQRVVEVRAGDAYRVLEHHIELRPTQLGDYERLLARLADEGLRCERVLHAWNLDSPAANLDGALEAGFFAPLALAKALARLQRPLRLALLVQGAFQVESGDRVAPAQALLVGPARVIPSEYPQLRCAVLDLIAGDPEPRAIEQVLAELHDERFGDQALVALRGARRLLPTYDRIELPRVEPPRDALVVGGVYLITGGLGGIGLVLARHLLTHYQARLLLLGRSAFPEQAQWSQWLAEHDDDDPTSVRIRALEEALGHGGEVLVARADVTDPAALAAALAEMNQRWGRLDGAIHAAGIAGGGVIELKTTAQALAVIAPKLQGTQALAAAIAPYRPAFLALCSSTSALLPEFGQVDYCAANACLDAFAERGLEQTRVVSINWSAWREVGMAVDTYLPESLRQARAESLRKALSSTEGAEAFCRALASGQPRLVVSPSDFESVREQAAVHGAAALTAATEPAAVPAMTHPRPNLAASFVAPRNDAETRIAQIWQSQIGLDRVGVDDNFFELGGDSLMGLQVVTLINRAFSSAITAAGLYEAPTVAAVARLVAGEPDPDRGFERQQSRGSTRKAMIRSIKDKSNRGSAHAKPS